MHASSLPHPLVLSDRGCPFAQRVFALLDHLDLAHDARQATLGALPDGIERWSPSGRIPLLVHGALVIGESRVMLEHLADAYAFDAAYPRELVPRTLQRHAMALLDVVLVPLLVGDDTKIEERRLAECLDVFEAVAVASPPDPCLLTFHFAPLWLRFQWWRPAGRVTRGIRARQQLAAWLDVATQLAPVVHTSPGRAESVADFDAACELLRRTA